MADSNKSSDSIKPNKKEAKPDFLTLQQNDARTAITRVVSDMGSALKAGGDVKEWARQYPWLTTGAVAAAGFVVGMLITPSKSKSLQAKYQELKDALTPKPTADELAAALADEKRKSDKPSLLAGLLGQLTKSIGPIIAGMASGAIAQPDANAAPTTPPASAAPDIPEGFGVYRDQRYAHS